MTDLSHKVLAAITAKREAAAALSVKAAKEEAQFREAFADLLAAFDELQAANVGTRDGRFSWDVQRDIDDQKRVAGFHGIKFRFGSDGSFRRHEGYSLRPYAGVGSEKSGYRIGGIRYVGDFHERLKDLGRIDSYGVMFSVSVERGKEAEITAFLIDYIGMLADR